jgi:hypothetical protein
MNEVVVKIDKSTKKGKKYMAVVQNKKTRRTRVLHFGGLGYEQFKDSTGLGLYSNVNHGDPKRRRNYFGRHSNGNTTKRKALNYEIKKSKGLYTPRLLSHKYLW